MSGKPSILVLSDLHVFTGSPANAKAPSFLGTSDSSTSIRRNPFTGLIELLKGLNYAPQLVICPGDMTNQADENALLFAWTKIHDIAKAISAVPIGTAGNHDIDSRYKSSGFDRLSAVRKLNPLFPINDVQLTDKFWSQHFFISRFGDFRILSINSSAFHGMGRISKAEREHGRISPTTIEAIEAALESDGLSPSCINIAVCHHHPFPHPEINSDDYSAMKGGERLVQLLGTGKYGAWTIIHGHRHRPRLQFANGTNAAPLVLGAASLGKKLDAELSAHTRNQFHTIEYHSSEANTLGLDLCGVIRSWDWIPEIGWRPPNRGSGLPARCGFGFRASAKHLAAEISKWRKNLKAYSTRRELEIQFPHLHYLSPTDEDLVVEELQTLGHQVQFDQTGAMSQLE